ncbi:MAG: HAMP domain-containing protein, partial [Alphaproteobacteria bacterium]
MSDVAETGVAEQSQAPESGGAESKAGGLFGIALSIRYKLFLAFGVVAALTIVAAVLGVVSFAKVRGSFEDLATHGIAAVADASKLAVQSNRIANAAVDLSNARAEYDRATAYGELATVVNGLDSEVSAFISAYSSSVNTSGLKSSMEDLKKNLAKLDKSTKLRLAAYKRKSENLEELFREHQEISKSFLPIVDDAYFEAVLATEMAATAPEPQPEPAKKADPMVEWLAKLKAADDAYFETVIAIETEGESKELLEKLQAADDAYFEAVLAIEELESKPAPKAEPAGDVAKAPEEETTTGAEHLARLKLVLEADSTLHQLVAVLVQGALTDDSTAIVPLQDRINGYAAKLIKALEEIGDANLTAKMYVVAAFADAETGLLADRAEELAAIEESNGIITEMFFLSQQLSSAIDGMVATQRRVTAEAAQGVDALMNTSQTIMLLVGIASLLLAGLIGYFVVHKGLTLRLERLIRSMKQLAEGNIDFDFPNSVKKDEIGEMVRAVHVFRDNAQERARLAGEQEEQQIRRAKRQQIVDQLITDFRSRVSDLLASVTSNMGEMRSTAEALSGIASDATAKAGEANQATEVAAG